MDIKGEQLKYVQFEKLKKYDDIVFNAVTLRGDDFIHNDLESTEFLNSKKKISQELAVDENDIFFIRQIHGKEIKKVEAETANEVNECDGLITNVRNKLLITCYADCVPLLFFDPTNKVVASVHSGWKGTIQKIGKEAVKKMIAEYNSKPENIIACVGPSIGACCFEVEKELFEQFEENFAGCGVKKNEKLYVNLQEANKIQMREIGIKDENIDCMDICTSCNSDKFYSYRKGDKEAGRFAVGIMLK